MALFTAPLNYSGHTESTKKNVAAALEEFILELSTNILCSKKSAQQPGWCWEEIPEGEGLAVALKH